jgi:hypothetical protein
MAIFMGKIAAIRSIIIFVSNNDNHEPQMHLWIICELQILIINGGPEIRSIIGSFQLCYTFLSLTNKQDRNSVIAK